MWGESGAWSPVGWNSVESVDSQHARQNGELGRLVEEGREMEYAGYDELMRGPARYAALVAKAQEPGRWLVIVHWQHGGPR